MKLIDKAAVVAEIEKCYNECLTRAKITDSDYWNAKADAYRNVLTILDNTLEVKEVDLEKEMDKYFENMEVKEHENIFESTFQKIAKHFFELGIKANCGNNSYDYFNIGYIQAIGDACKWLQEKCTYTHPRKGTKECVVNIPRFKNDLLE